MEFKAKKKDMVIFNTLKAGDIYRDSSNEVFMKLFFTGNRWNSVRLRDGSLYMEIDEALITPVSGYFLET